MPLYEIVLRREGFVDEVRLTDHAGFSVGDSIRVDRYDCLVTSTKETSRNAMVAQRVICRLAVDTSLAARVRRQRLLGEALDRFGAAAFVFDARGVVAAANKAAATMTGYSRTELSELDCTELMAKPGDAKKRIVAGSLRSGDSVIRQKDGTMLPVRFRVGATMLESGERAYLSLCWPLP